jgi:hypothetical protein
MCWIAEYPAYCSLRDTCERGSNANTYRWAFLYAWVFAVFLYMAICMSLIYYKVLSAERATDRWTQASGQCRRRKLSRKVAAQGLKYVVAFIFPWIFGITVSIMLNQTYGNISASARFGHAMTTLEIVNAVIWPLKGFFTFLAYMRPRRKDGGGRTTQITTSRASSTKADSAESNSKSSSRIPNLSFKSFVAWSKMARRGRESEVSTGGPVSLDLIDRPIPEEKEEEEEEEALSEGEESESSPNDTEKPELEACAENGKDKDRIDHGGLNDRGKFQ